MKSKNYKIFVTILIFVKILKKLIFLKRKKINFEITKFQISISWISIKIKNRVVIWDLFIIIYIIKKFTYFVIFFFFFFIWILTILVYVGSTFAMKANNLVRKQVIKIHEHKWKVKSRLQIHTFVLSIKIMRSICVTYIPIRLS